jgi:hypothetical protein
MLARGLPGLLGPIWRLSPPYEIEPIASGMNSVVVGVALPVARYVAKWFQRWTERRCMPVRGP